MSELNLSDSDPVSIEELKTELESLERRRQYIAEWILSLEIEDED